MQTFWAYLTLIVMAVLVWKRKLTLGVAATILGANIIGNYMASK